MEDGSGDIIVRQGGPQEEELLKLETFYEDIDLREGYYHRIIVTNRLDPIEELYDMYSEEEDTLGIVKLGDDGLDFVSDIEGLANPYMDL